MLPRPAEGSWGLAESAPRGRMRAEKEKQRREVACSKLYAEIISVWMSGLGLDTAVGDGARFPGQGEVPCERGSRSWSCSPGFSGGGKALFVESTSHLWMSSPHGAETRGSAGGSPQALPRGLHPSLWAQWVSCTPQPGRCSGSQWVNLLCEPGVPGQGWGSQHPFYQPGAAGTAFLGSPWVRRLRSAPLSSRGEPRAAPLTAGRGGLAPREKIT